METPRDVVHIRGDFTGNSDQRIELRSERGLRFNRELFKLLKVDAEKGQALDSVLEAIATWSHQWVDLAPALVE
jgi:hypothetical protein